MMQPKKKLNPAQYFQKVYQGFLRAKKESLESFDNFYQIGNFRVHFDFSNSALIPYITPAFEHLKTSESSQIDLTVCFWDSRSSKIQLEAFPWTGIQGGTVNFHGNNHYINYDFTTGILSSYDSINHKAIFWIKDANKVPYYVSGTPLLSVLHWRITPTDYQLVHAGAIGTPKGGVLLVGQGGSGKSTTSITALNSNLFYLGDDYCIVDSKTLDAFSLYSTAKLRPDMLKNFPHLTPALSNGKHVPKQKPLFFLNPLMADKIQRRFPIKGIFVPRVTNQENTTIKETTPIAALKALAPSTIFQLSGMGENILKKTTAMVKNLPCYHLELGTKLDQIPKVISEFLV